MQTDMLQGKVVAVTGESRSVVREIAWLCAKYGAVLWGSYPAETPDQQLRVERHKTEWADRIASLMACLASDSSQAVLRSKPRPMRSMTTVEGWTPESIADELVPSFMPSMARSDEVSAHVFPYDPI